MPKKKQHNNLFYNLGVIVIIVICGIYTITTTNLITQKENANYIEEKKDKIENEITNEIINNGELKIHFIDVGQGDSILITQNNESMLIDAGDNKYGETVTKYLKDNDINSLKYIIGTHGDADHIGGLDIVINNYNVDTILFPKQTKTTQTYIDFVTSVKNKNMQFTAPVVGQIYELGDAEFKILSPEDIEYNESNNYSIIIKLEYYNTTYLFMGDAEKDIEEKLIENNVDISADLIKIGHHGSNSSSMDSFIKKVNPQYGIIMCGQNNKYGHPHEQTLSTLKKYNVKIFRTDINGNILVTSNGNNINIVKEKN